MGNAPTPTYRHAPGGYGGKEKGDPATKIVYSRGAMPEVIIPILAANSKYKEQK